MVDGPLIALGMFHRHDLAIIIYFILLFFFFLMGMTSPFWCPDSLNKNLNFVILDFSHWNYWISCILSMSSILSCSARCVRKSQVLCIPLLLPDHLPFFFFRSSFFYFSTSFLLDLKMFHYLLYPSKRFC